MPNYSLLVQANISSEYYGNVYAIAFKTPYSESNVEEVTTFVINEKHRLNKMKNNTEQSMLSSISTRYSTYITDMFSNIYSTDTHNIPHNFSDYSVFIVVENELGLTNTNYTGRFNAFSRLREEELVTNTIVVFADHQNQDFSINTIHLSSNILHISQPVEYYVVGFVEDPPHPDFVYGYIDQLKEYSNIYGATDPFVDKLLVHGVATPPFISLNAREITHVVNDTSVLEDTSLYSINDINHAVIYLYIKDKSSGNVSLDKHFLFQDTSNVAHARIKEISFNSEGNIETTLSGFSAFSSPSSWKVVAIERNNDTDTLTKNEIKHFIDIVSSTVVVNSTELKTVFNQNITCIDAIYDKQGSTRPINTHKEYSLAVLLIVSNFDDNDFVQLPTNLQVPEFSESSNVSEYFNNPNIENIGAMSVSFEFGNIYGDVVVNSHPIANINTTGHLLASTVPSYTTTSEIMHYVRNDYASANITSLQNINLTKVIDSTGKLVNINAVNNINLYSYVNSFDNIATSDGYENMGNLNNNSLWTDSNIVFPLFNTIPILHGYDKITANLASVFNNSSASLSNINMFLREVNSGYLDLSSNIFNGVVSGYELVDNLDTTIVFDKAYDQDGQIQISKDRSYELMVSMGTVTANIQVDTTQIVGITSFGKRFNTNGNIEVTLTSNIGSSNDTLYGIAFTYDVMEGCNGNITEFQNKVRQHTNKQTLTSSPNNMTPSASFQIEKIVDIRGNLENAYGTNNAFVYLWIENDTTSENSAVNTQQLSNAEYLYPHIPENSMSFMFGKITITDATLLESNIVSNGKIDSYYLYVTDVVDPVTQTEAISYFNGNAPSTFGVYKDIASNVDTHDIFNVPTCTVSHILKNTGVTGVTSVGITPSTEYQAVLIAINTAGDHKAFLTEIIDSGSDGHLITDTDVSLNTFPKRLEIHANVEGSTEAIFNIIVFTDETDDGNVFSKTPLYTQTYTGFTEVNANLSNVYDANYDVELSYVNNMYVYAYLSDTDTSTTSPVTLLMSESSDDMYPRVQHANTDVVEFSVFVPQSANGTAFEYTAMLFNPSLNIEDLTDTIISGQILSSSTIPKNSLVMNDITNLNVIQDVNNFAIILPAQSNVAYDLVVLVRNTEVPANVATLRITSNDAPRVINTNINVVYPYVMDLNTVVTSDDIISKQQLTPPLGASQLNYYVMAFNYVPDTNANIINLMNERVANTSLVFSGSVTSSEHISESVSFLMTDSGTITTPNVTDFVSSNIYTYIVASTDTITGLASSGDTNYEISNTITDMFSILESARIVDVSFAADLSYVSATANIDLFPATPVNVYTMAFTNLQNDPTQIPVHMNTTNGYTTTNVSASVVNQEIGPFTQALQFFQGTGTFVDINHVHTVYIYSLITAANTTLLDAINNNLYFVTPVGQKSQVLPPGVTMPMLEIVSHATNADGNVEFNTRVFSGTPVDELWTFAIDTTNMNIQTDVTIERLQAMTDVFMIESINGDAFNYREGFAASSPLLLPDMFTKAFSNIGTSIINDIDAASNYMFVCVANVDGTYTAITGPTYGTVIDASSFITPSSPHSITNYDNQLSVIKIRATTNTTWQTIICNVDDIYIENVPGNEYSFEYSYSTNSTLVHGFLWIAEDNDTLYAPNHILWETNLSGIYNLIPFPELSNGTTMFIKVEVPYPLGELILHWYSDAAHTTLVATQTQTEVASRLNNQTTHTNTDSSKKWKLSFLTNNYNTPDANTYQIFGNFRKLGTQTPDRSITWSELSPTAIAETVESVIITSTMNTDASGILKLEITDGYIISNIPIEDYWIFVLNDFKNVDIANIQSFFTDFIKDDGTWNVNKVYKVSGGTSTHVTLSSIPFEYAFDDLHSTSHNTILQSVTYGLVVVVKQGGDYTISISTTVNGSSSNTRDMKDSPIARLDSDWIVNDIYNNGGYQVYLPTPPYIPDSSFTYNSSFVESLLNVGSQGGGIGGLTIDLHYGETTSVKRYTKMVYNVNGYSHRDLFVTINNSPTFPSVGDTFSFIYGTSSWSAPTFQGAVEYDLSSESDLACTGRYLHVKIQTGGYQSRRIALSGIGIFYMFDDDGLQFPPKPDIWKTTNPSNELNMNFLTNTIINGFDPISNNTFPVKYISNIYKYNLAFGTMGKNIYTSYAQNDGNFTFDLNGGDPDLAVELENIRYCIQGYVFSKYQLLVTDSTTYPSPEDFESYGINLIGDNVTAHNHFLDQEFTNQFTGDVRVLADITDRLGATNYYNISCTNQQGRYLHGYSKELHKIYPQLTCLNSLRIRVTTQSSNYVKSLPYRMSYEWSQ
jgi:hypothetical protein